MKTLKLLGTIVTTIVPLLLAVSCSTAALLTAPLPTATAIPPAPQLPLGMYVRPGQEKGLELLDGGKYNKYSVGGVIASQGTYTVTQDQIVFVNSEGTQGMNVCTVPGTYKWAFDGKALTLTVVEDGCAVRRDTWQGSWIKQP